MLRSAEEIIKEEFNKAEPSKAIFEIYREAIRTAQREAIQEALMVATVDHTSNPLCKYSVNKQSILNLLNQIK